MNTGCKLTRSQWQFLEAMPDAVLLTLADGSIAFANTRAENLFGYPLEEFADLTIESLLPEGIRRRHAENRTGYNAHPQVRV